MQRWKRQLLSDQLHSCHVASGGHLDHTLTCFSWARAPWRASNGRSHLLAPRGSPWPSTCGQENKVGPCCCTGRALGGSRGAAHSGRGREAGLLLGQQQRWAAGHAHLQGPEFPSRGQEPRGHARHPGGLWDPAHPLPLRVRPSCSFQELWLCTLHDLADRMLVLSAGCRGTSVRFNH